VISVEADSYLGLLPSDDSFGRLLLGTAGLLVGFDMAKLALRLHRDLKLPVLGIDLSTLFSKNTREPWRPSQFINAKVSPSINKFQVDNLWNSANEQGNRNVCLRAWLSAWYVLVKFLVLIYLIHIPGDSAAAACVSSQLGRALKVDTRLVFDTVRGTLDLNDTIDSYSAGPVGAYLLRRLLTTNRPFGELQTK
jgi:regulator of nonsense transcripts 1